MKGWLFTETGVEPKLIEKEDPRAGVGEVVIDVKAAGLCHSDVSALEDPKWMGLITAAPVIFGHECAGVISEVGEGVTGLQVGDRVGVAPQHPDSPLEAIGYTRDGGYATKILVPAVQCVPMPDAVTFPQGAVATDAGMTSHHALFEVGGAKAGMKVGIIGVGGLGQFAVQMALAVGCEVYAVDISPSARESAKQYGCHGVYENVLDLKEHECELIVNYSGAGNTTADALEVLGYQGTLVIVGMISLEAHINTYPVIIGQLTIKGSNGGTAADIKSVYDFFASGKLTPQLSTIGFEEIKDGLGRLQRHEVKGRLVAVME